MSGDACRVGRGACRTSGGARPVDPGVRPVRRGAWHRQPLFWLGASILAASLAGCAWMILLASRYPDPALETGGEQILRMPLGASPARVPAPMSAPMPASASPR